MALLIWHRSWEIGGDGLRTRPFKAVVQSLSFWPTPPGRVTLSLPWRCLDPYPTLGCTRRSPCSSWSPPLRAMRLMEPLSEGLSASFAHFLLATCELYGTESVGDCARSLAYLDLAEKRWGRATSSRLAHRDSVRRSSV